MQRSTLFTLAIIAVLIVVAAVATYYTVMTDRETERNQARRDLTSGETAAPFTDLSGQEVSLETHLGQKLIVNAWASWSPYASEELPLLDRVAGDYDDVVVLAINRSESKEETERFMRTLPEFSHIEFILDPDDRFFKAVDGYAMPETIIYNEDGEVVLHRRGVITEVEIRTAIDGINADE